MNLAFLESRGIGRLMGNDCEFDSLSIDTRTLRPGQLFVALRGKNFDAHKFIDQAKYKGACGLVLEEEQDIDLPMLVVADSVQALGSIASLNRKDFDGTVIAVTGSCGKTTVKEMLRNICNRVGACVATRGNLNNHIGVPLTLMALRKSCEFAVVEAGTSGIGEISYLADMIQPDVSLITNIMPAHLEGFGSLEAIALEKSSIYGEEQSSTLAVVNLDDAQVDVMLNKIGSKRFVGFTLKKYQELSVNLAKSCDVISIEDHWADRLGRMRFSVKIGSGLINIALAVIGSHNLQNALAAAATAWAAGVDTIHIKSGLETFSGVHGRMQILPLASGAIVVNDTYNANPGSMKAAIDYLATQKNTLLICGDMAELGENSSELHAEVGRYAKGKGIKQLFSIGDSAESISEAFGRSALHFKNRADLAKKLKVSIRNDSVILVKGSRCAKMETLIDDLIQTEEGK